tara:strand:+ start:1595 stop:1825 length:231 start_codon:yes stop_codon:yes gene_type:complete
MDNENNTPEEVLTIGQLSNAIDVIERASRDTTSRQALIQGLSDVFNPEMFSMIGAVNDNYSDTLERMREAFGVKAI